MYYLLMKTLVKPQTNSTIAIDSYQNDLRRKIEILNSKNKRGKQYWNLLFVFLSFAIFFIFPESPQMSASICNKYHSEIACNQF